MRDDGLTKQRIARVVGVRHPVERNAVKDQPVDGDSDGACGNQQQASESEVHQRECSGGTLPHPSHVPSIHAERLVLVDARPLQGPDAGRGVGTYVRGLLDGLVEEGAGERVGVLIDAGLEVPELPAVAAAFRVRRRYPGRLAAYEEAFAAHRDLALIGPAVYHATSLRLPARAPCPLVATVHDLIPWALDGRRLLGERIRYAPGRRLLRRADRVLAVSEATAEDAVRLADVSRERIQVIPEGVSPRFQPAPEAAARVRERWQLEPHRYLLYVGALDARKDPAALFRAWEIAREAIPELPLVLAGHLGPQAPSDLRSARTLGYVSEPDLVDLLSAAGCLVFPSRYEGFGLPVLEAMACGCPVTAFENSSLPEVAGRAVALVPDGDAESLGRAAARLISSSRERAQAVKAGLNQARRFNWRRMARATLAAYEDLLP